TFRMALRNCRRAKRGGNTRTKRGGNTRTKRGAIHNYTRRKENEEKQAKSRETETKQENLSHDWYGVLFYGV
ncbi:MAG: hypothetical protein K2N24_10885, partial [Lachnospiraceae bacterium]|nr:hypothetical protein [Lachnospiraceae bacterium]